MRASANDTHPLPGRGSQIADAWRSRGAGSPKWLVNARKLRDNIRMM